MDNPPLTALAHVCPSTSHKNAIVQVVQHLRPGGIETLSLDLMSFAANNERAYIISLEGDIETAIKHWPRLAAYKSQLIFLNKSARLTPFLINQLQKVFKFLNADTIHTHHIGPLLYAGFAARLAGIKHLIHTEHDAWHLQNNKHRRLQQGLIKLLKPALVADAETVAQAMKTQLSYKKPITVIRNGIDTDFFMPGNLASARQQLKLPLGVALIGCSGRLEEVKGQSILIYALTQLPINTHLVFAGIGSTEQQLRKQVNHLNLSQRVHFLGRIDNMPLFYQSLDVFCLPSLNEGFPLSPLEAQSCNIPAVVTNVGGAAETLCPYSGKLIPANDQFLMAAALKELLTQNSQRLIDASQSISPLTPLPRQFVLKHGNILQMVKAYAGLRNAGEHYA